MVEQFDLQCNNGFMIERKWLNPWLLALQLGHKKYSMVEKNTTTKMRVLNVSSNQFQVKEGGIKEGFVDIRNKTCSCRVFQVDQFVCAHAIVVCLYFWVDPISFCSCYYTKETLVMTYSAPIIPVGDMANWEITADVQTM